MQVEALKNFAYARRRYRRGDVLTVRDQDGRALMMAGAATLAGPVVNESPKVEISARTGKPKRKYKRRDMVAE